MKIKIVRVKKWMAQGFISPIDRAMNQINKLGISFVDANPDITMLQVSKATEHEIDKQIDQTKTPIVIQDFTNSTILQWYRLLDKKNVIGYIKGQRNVKDEIEGLHIGWNMALIKMPGNDYTKNDTYFDNNRDIDIHHATSINVNPSFDESVDEYIAHRTNAHNKINMICKKYGYIQSGPCKAKEYRDKMIRSKVCLSPWGMGEICHRTFEAIRLGAIPIVPDSSHIVTWPNIFKPYEYYIPCKYDFSDLEYIITEVINNYESYRHISKNAFYFVRNAWNNKVFAKRFVDTMENIWKLK
jgi:hypothetical protein